MGREAAATATCAPARPKLRRGLWSPEEDEKLYNHIIRYGVGCWSSVPKLAGLERCGKSCRLRWINYLRPDLKRGSFSQQEEELIISLHKILGNRWSQIASQLPGRTDNEIKNFWNSCLKKKLRQRGIDPSTHKPLNDDAAAAAEPQDDKHQLQQPPEDDHCFSAAAAAADPLALPHSPVFDPLAVPAIPIPGSYGSAAPAAASFRSETICDYSGSTGLDVVSDATTYTAYTGDSSSNSGTWPCSNVVACHEPFAHIDMYPFDPKFSPWQHQQHAVRLDGGGGDSGGNFPIRSLSRDLSESCFDIARGALEDEFSVDFL